MTATAMTPAEAARVALTTSPLADLYFVMRAQDRADLLALIDDAHVKAKTPLGRRLAVLRDRIDRRST